ncbi:MAG: hypothetical protein NT007_00305, partial [Candidatus Kapabacteria bacterium]|nr:hypothetical protein [Candidatus Kapabacteria bacterium]
MKLIISFCLIFFSLIGLKANPEWICFKIYMISGTTSFDFIKQFDVNKIWIRNSIIEFYKNIDNRITSDNNIIINNFEFDKSHNLWIASPLGIKKISLFDTIKYNYKTRNITDVTIDIFDNKWFASDSGLIKFDNINWSLLNRETSSFPTNRIWHLCLSTNGELWSVFSDSGSIGRFDGKVWKFYNSTQTGIKALGMDIRIVSDTSGRIWLR